MRTGDGGMTSENRFVAAAMLFLILIIVAGLLVYELPYDTLFWIEVQNAGHTPVFGIISLLILGASLRLLGSRIPQRPAHYAIALAGATFLGLISEYAQIAGPRDADVCDFIRDIAGAVSFLGIFMYADGKLRTAGGKLMARIRTAVLITAILVLVAALVPLALWSGAYLHRNGTFPAICDFDSYWGNRFLRTEDARLESVAPPSGWIDARGEVGRVVFGVDDYPGLVIREVYPDWRGYGSLVFDIYSPANTSVNLHVRIEDFSHNGDFADRFNRATAIRPGASRVSIPLADIKEAPVGREMNMQAIRAIHLFVVGPEDELVLYFDNLTLK
jgi:hypothetical protein